MPRFAPETTRVLKERMALRAPEFKFTKEDVEEITKLTGMSATQVQKWAEFWRYRYTTLEERLEHLSLTHSVDLNIQARRFFIFAFGMSPEKLQQFFIPKRSGDPLYPKFLYASFSEEGDFMECHMEFEDAIRDGQLVHHLEEWGCSQVVVATYPAKDNNQAVLAALERITEQVIEKGHIQFMHGEQPHHLEMLTTVHNTISAKRKEKLSKQEFDEKTRAVISMQTEKLDEIGERAVKIEQGVCGVIPDYQREIKTLKEKLAHKTTEVDRIEYAMSRKTMEINQLKKDMEQKNITINMQATEIQSLKTDLASAILHLTQAHTWGQIAERVEGLLNQCTDVMGEFRALKRQRGDGEDEESVIELA